jgi:hypothetical protein
MLPGWEEKMGVHGDRSGFEMELIHSGISWCKIEI